MEVQEFVALTSSQVMELLQVQGPKLEKPRPKVPQGGHPLKATFQISYWI